MILNNSLFLIGLEIYPSQPASLLFCLSVDIAKAVWEITGSSGLKDLISLTRSQPDASGSLTSRRTRSNGVPIMISRASSPQQADDTVCPIGDRIVLMYLEDRQSSSTTRILSGRDVLHAFSIVVGAEVFVSLLAAACVVSGIWKVNVEPLPTSLSTQI